MKTAVQMVRRMKVEEERSFSRGGGVDGSTARQRRISRAMVVEVEEGRNEKVKALCQVLQWRYYKVRKFS